MVAKILSACFALLFPDECRVCRRPLSEISRVPVCRDCLNEPAPFEAEHFCSACGAPFANAFPLGAEGRCMMCRLGLRGFDAAYCYGAYDGVLKELVHLFKYGRVTTLARPLGERLALALPRDQRFDFVVPLPMHWRRRWKRGFNQSELLACEISRRSAIPLVKAVKRIKATQVQAGLSGPRRRKNVLGAFAVTKPSPIQGKRILLVDDVMTTGSTASACAAALKSAGAAHVAVLALARADRRWNSRSVPPALGDGTVLTGASS